MNEPERGIAPASMSPSNRTQKPNRSFWTEQIDLWVAALAGVAIAAYLVMRFALPTTTTPAIAEAPLWIAIVIGGAPLLWRLIRAAAAGNFGSDLLAGFSIVAGVLNNQPLVAAIIVLMLSGGASLERYATGHAKSVLEALQRRTPQVAHRRTESGPVDIPLDEVQVGDALVILPHELAPVDGIVTEGHGRMNEAFLTGEPFEMAKTPGSPVLSGATNGEDVLHIEATKIPADSRHAQIVRLLERAEQDRPAVRRVGDRLGAWYTVLALSIAVAAWLISGDPLRFLAVTVIATPCPLLIGIPVAVLGAISLAAKHGVIVKTPAALEQMDQCSTIILDKTGTLTYGSPSLSEIIRGPGVTEQELLQHAGSLEQYSKHPLASAVLDAVRQRGLVIPRAERVSEKPGQGLQGTIGGIDVRITGRGKLPEMELPPVAGGLECIVLFGDRLAGILRFRDAPRKESRPFISHLAGRHGVRRVVLLSGDRELEVRYLADHVGIDEIYFEKSPEEKVEIVKQAAAQAKTIFIGDGINDAPAMMMATVGIALGSRSEITAEAADAVVLDSSLEKADTLVHIGRRMRRIALQSAIGGMALSMIGMGFAAMGLLTPVLGAVVQELIDIAAVGNALRVGFSRDRLADF